MTTTQKIAHAGPQATDDPNRLLAACRAGDPDAWEAMMERYERLVYAIAIREGLSSEDAADVAQVTFEAFIDAMPRLNSETSIGAWFASVARRQAWRQRDRRRREAAVLRREGHEVAVVEWIDEPSVEIDERVLELHECLVSLGEPCRAILTALYFDPDRPSYADIATTLGRPVGSIGPTRARCLQQMRSQITFSETS